MVATKNQLIQFSKSLQAVVWNSIHLKFDGIFHFVLFWSTNLFQSYSCINRIYCIHHLNFAHREPGRVYAFMYRNVILWCWNGCNKRAKPQESKRTRNQNNNMRAQRTRIKCSFFEFACGNYIYIHWPQHYYEYHIVHFFLYYYCCWSTITEKKNPVLTIYTLMCFQ